MTTCTLLVGVPASGKSTYCKNNGIIPCSTDNVIEYIANQYGYTYDSSFRDLIKFADKVFWDNITSLSEQNQPIVIDRTNLSVKSRKRFIDLLKPLGYTFDAIVFATPEPDEWNRRLNSRIGKYIPPHVLENMVKNFENPTYPEGFANISYV